MHSLEVKFLHQNENLDANLKHYHPKYILHWLLSICNIPLKHNYYLNVELDEKIFLHRLHIFDFQYFPLETNKQKNENGNVVSTWI